MKQAQQFLTGFVLLVVLVSQSVAADDLDAVRSKRYRLDDSRKLQYVLIGSKKPVKAPEDGYKLLVVLPGGDGSAEFSPFVKRIYLYGLSEEYLVVQLIAPEWNKKQRVVWPTDGLPERGMKISTEKFIQQAVADVGKRTKVDSRHVFALAWSSGGPAAYAASMSEQTPLTGMFAAMSVFKEKKAATLKLANGKAYYILHSEADQVCPYWMARKASEVLAENGGKVKLQTYEGGHGWRGNVFGNISAGINWLEENAAELK